MTQQRIPLTRYVRGIFRAHKTNALYLGYLKHCVQQQTKCTHRQFWSAISSMMTNKIIERDMGGTIVRIVREPRQ